MDPLWIGSILVAGLIVVLLARQAVRRKHGHTKAGE
jgi:hypothetical protein